MERITAAAVIVGDQIHTGVRHGQIMQKLWEESPGTRIFLHQQGFVTDTGRFVSRREAADIAYVAGQVKSRGVELFSEDVW